MTIEQFQNKMKAVEKTLDYAGNHIDALDPKNLFLVIAVFEKVASDLRDIEAEVKVQGVNG